MKKFFIIFFGVLFLLALVIGQCNGDDTDEDEEFDAEQEKMSFVDGSIQQEQESGSDNIDENTNSETKEESTLEEHEIPNSTPEVNMSALEIPRLTINQPEQILVRAGYTTSYNNKTKNANWVAWHLTKEHTSGNWSRDGIPYTVDTDVKGGRQELEDWYGHTLPIDHGHMCPAGDCKWSKDAMVQSFLLTNMCPQNSNLNRGDWEELESRCRGWARHYGEIFIACGPIFYNKAYQTIGDNKVGVPDAFYKVILCMSKTPKALGFIYPNNGTHHNMQYYVTTVDKVEETTGIDFFYNLPDDIENDIESIANFKKW